MTVCCRPLLLIMSQGCSTVVNETGVKNPRYNPADPISTTRPIESPIAFSAGGRWSLTLAGKQMKLWQKALLAGFVSEAIALSLWLFALLFSMARPPMSQVARVSAYLGWRMQYPGFLVGKWAHEAYRNGFTDSIYLVAIVSFLFWCVMWAAFFFIKKRRHHCGTSGQ